LDVRHGDGQKTEEGKIKMIGLEWLKRWYANRVSTEPDADRIFRRQAREIFEHLHKKCSFPKPLAREIRQALEQAPIDLVSELHDLNLAMIEELTRKIYPITVKGYEPDERQLRALPRPASQLYVIWEGDTEETVTVRQLGFEWFRFDGQISPGLEDLNRQMANLARDIQKHEKRAAAIRQMIEKSEDEARDALEHLKFDLWELGDGQYKNLTDLYLEEKDGQVCLMRQEKILSILPIQVGQPLWDRQFAANYTLDRCEEWVQEASKLEDWVLNEPRHLELLRRDLTKALKKDLPEVFRLWRQGWAVILIMETGLKIIVQQGVDEILEKMPEVVFDQLAVELKHGLINLPAHVIRALGLMAEPAVAAAEKTAPPTADLGQENSPDAAEVAADANIPEEPLSVEDAIYAAGSRLPEENVKAEVTPAEGENFQGSIFNALMNTDGSRTETDVAIAPEDPSENTEMTVEGPPVPGGRNTTVVFDDGPKL
jgi:hypothetical protein